MRRREKFVITAIVLSFGLLGVQLVPLEYRYFAVALIALLTYGAAGWALAEDLQRFEWVTVIPFPAFYALAVGLFYFLLPSNIVTRFAILGLFGVGMYALLLTANIFAVAKAKTIQLLHAAHAIGLYFTLLTSLLLTNTVFSLKFPWYINGIIVAIIHWPLIFMSLWSVNLEQRVSREVITLSTIMTALVAELAIILSLYPISVWNTALLIMALVYLGLGILHTFLRGKLFENTLTEYSLVAAFIGIVFLFLFPWK